MIREFLATRSDGERLMVEISDEFGNATQMLKEDYDEMIANQQSAPIAPTE